MCVLVELEMYRIYTHQNHGIPRNFVKFRDTKFRIIPRNFGQFRREYGIYGSKKHYGIPRWRNSVNTLIDGHLRRPHLKDIFWRLAEFKKSHRVGRHIRPQPPGIGLRGRCQLIAGSLLEAGARFGAFPGRRPPPPPGCATHISEVYPTARATYRCTIVYISLNPFYCVF
jgi:hypothetical protein